MVDQLGDGPIERKFKSQMNALAGGIDEILNGENKGADRKNGFILIMFAFDSVNQEGARANYISNASRADVVVMLKEQIARFEGQSMKPGHA